MIFHSYKPKPLKTFIIQDPKTRKISSSDFKDRLVHHALCNIIEPIFDKSFIYDSYANRRGKGALNAVKRFDYFKGKASKNNTRNCFVFKADIKHYFETVDHKILINIIKRKIKNIKIIHLTKIILANYKSKKVGKGMPLGNLTSQFLANLYLNELDQFIKHKLKAKYYIRYVDDFVILHNSKEKLEYYKQKIFYFLNSKLKIELHPDKSKIYSYKQGTEFLGFKIFPFHKLLKKKNINKFKRKLSGITGCYAKNLINYDKIYDFLEGWVAFAKLANTYNLRIALLNSLEKLFRNETSSKEINNFLKNCYFTS